MYGRSLGFSINRILLYNTADYTENQATDTRLSQSFTVCR